MFLYITVFIQKNDSKSVYSRESGVKPLSSNKDFKNLVAPDPD